MDDVAPGNEPRRGLKLVLAGVALALAALPLNFAALEVPLLRTTGAVAWTLTLAGVACAGLGAARDARWGVRALVIVPVVVLGLWSTLWFKILPLPVTAAVEAKAKAPEFTLPDQTGKPVSLAAAHATGPVLLVFYRGHW